MRLCSWRSKRGNAMIEFALSAGVLIPILAGTFQFGYGMYTYNKLQTAVDDGGRYASNRTYRNLLGATDTDKVKLAIKNMVVYGTPSPSNTEVPLVNGLGTGNVDVSFAVTSGLPRDPLPSGPRCRSFNNGCSRGPSPIGTCHLIVPVFRS